MISKKDYAHIESLFPEINLIKNKGLREKVAEVWITAWHDGTYKTIEECVKPMPLDPHYTAKQKAATAQGVTHSALTHARATAANAYAIAKNMKEIEGVDMDTDRLVATCLMHEARMMIDFESKDGVTYVSETSKRYPPFFRLMVIMEKVGVPHEIIYLIGTQRWHPPHILLRPGMGMLKYAKEGLTFYHANISSADIAKIGDDGMPTSPTHVEHRRFYEV
jgi:hypothetical protein